MWSKKDPEESERKIDLEKLEKKKTNFSLEVKEEPKTRYKKKKEKKIS